MSKNGTRFSDGAWRFTQFYMLSYLSFHGLPSGLLHKRAFAGINDHII